MAEYIKREEVRDMLHREIDEWGSCADEIEALLNANEKLYEIHAADVAPVVRCKDCKHRSVLGTCPMVETRLCNDGDGHYDLVEEDATTDYGFCSRGERRTDDV